MEIQIDWNKLSKRGLFVATPMYGGQCTGMFTKSIADLTALCKERGIPLIHYFLFNESLITRARNYCCDEFMRVPSESSEKDPRVANHLMFIDSDIGFNPMDVIAMMALQSNDPKYDLLGGAYPKKSLPFDAIIETEDGPQKLGRIVKDKYAGKVLSLSPSGEVEWKRVVNWFEDPGSPSKKWVTVGREKYVGHRKRLICTEDHEIYVSDDPINPKIYKIEAKDALGKYWVRLVNNKKTKQKIVFEPIEVVKEYTADSNVRRQYDISVEDNHNFFANNFAVSNCISWEKIVHAVKTGVADTNPNVLENFVGDFVFNPKGGQQNILIAEPCEVLELGTGFMMITREAMNKFYESYKHKYLYKPDHVRTEHFDGSREILQFFQAEIDKYDPVDDYKEALETITKVSNTKAKDIANKALTKKTEKSKRYLSEDYWFTQRSQEIGLQTWLCPWIKLYHVGTYIFGGSLADLAQINVAATADVSKLGKEKK